MGGLEGEVGGENAFGTAAPLLVQARSQIRLRAREAPKLTFCRCHLLSAVDLPDSQ